MATSFYSVEELNQLGFKRVGKNVLISRNTCIYGAEQIEIGNNVRIDDFCVLSGKIQIGNYVHVAVYSAVFGGDSGVVLSDFVGISSRCAVYAKSDDFSGEHLTNPVVPEKYLGVISQTVILNKYVMLGTGTTVLPGVEIGEGTAVGSMSLVNKSLDEWGIYTGIPCKYMRARSKKLLELEKDFLSKK